jgi:hypothetical protein
MEVINVNNMTANQAREFAQLQQGRQLQFVVPIQPGPQQQQQNQPQQRHDQQSQPRQ